MLSVDQRVRTYKRYEFSVDLPCAFKDISDAMYLATSRWKANHPGKDIYDDSLTATSDGEKFVVWWDEAVNALEDEFE